MRSMNRIIALLITALNAGAAFAATAPSKPNVLFILADDLGAHDVGCFGSTFHETPNIDRLASRGVKFTQAYAASPLCSPTRSSILAGVYPARSGITTPSCHEMRVNLEKKLVANPSPQMKAVNADSLTRLEVRVLHARRGAARGGICDGAILASGTSGTTSRGTTTTSRRTRGSTWISRMRRRPRAGWRLSRALEVHHGSKHHRESR